MRHQSQLRRRNRDMILAGKQPDPTPFSIVTGSDAVTITAAEAAAEGEKPKPSTFSIRAYNGGLMRVAAFYDPIAVDLKGLRANRVTVLKDHDMTQIVGQGTADVEASKLTVNGTFTGDVSDPKDPAGAVAMHAKNGFTWQGSVGVRPERLEYVRRDATAKANGKTISGPAVIVRAGYLGEVSFVSMGADETTSATVNVAATSAQQFQGDDAMNFEKWLEAMGLAIDDLSDEQKVKLQAKYDAEQKIEAEAGDNTDAGDDAETNDDDPIQQRRLTAAAEETRIAGIRAACGERQGEICAKAIKDGWSVDKTELEVLKADRPKTPAVNTPMGDRVTASALTAAIMFQSGLGSSAVEAAFNDDDQTLEVATRFRRSGLKGLIEAGMALDGMQRPSINATDKEWVQAAFSSNSMSSILSSSANKIMLASFTRNTGAAMTLFKRVSAKNFLTHTGYRMTGAGMEQVGQDGALKHGTLGDESKTFKVETYGEMLGITRQMIVNDDIGMFTILPERIGIDAANQIESVAWTLVKANTGTFFGSGNSNYISGGTSELGTTGLDNAVTALAEMTDSDSHVIRVKGRYVVVPPALQGAAQRLYKGSAVIATGVTSSSKIAANANIYEGAYEPVMVPDLSATIDTSNGDNDAWYLWADPAGAVAPFAIAFLNGIDRPTIEEVDPDPAYLGRTWRGYLDFGVAQWDEQGAVKAAGS